MIAREPGDWIKAMRQNKRHAGFTLIELIAVISIVVLVTAMVMPIVPRMLKSNREGAARDLIRGFLTLARAHAAQTQKYAGIRFQPSAKGAQYMVLIEYGDDVSNSDRFVAVANTKPIVLPDGIGTVATDTGNVYYDRTFSIVFSPTGQLVTRKVNIYERDSDDKTFGPYADTTRASSDPDYCLLSYDNVDTWAGAVRIVINDGAFDPGNPKYSVGELVIYEMGDENDPGTWLLVNMYTGTLIE